MAGALMARILVPRSLVTCVLVACANLPADELAKPPDLLALLIDLLHAPDIGTEIRHIFDLFGKGLDLTKSGMNLGGVHGDLLEG
jgi:hypothetical protein